MSKITITLPQQSVSAAANPYLMADGLLNFTAVEKLQAKVAAALKANPEAKVLGTFVIKRRAKPVKYSASLTAKADHKYLVARATKVVLRKRVTPESLAKVAVLLQLIDEPKLNPSFKQAQTAIARHQKKCESVLGKVTKEKGKLRDQANAEFDKNIDSIKDVLVAGGIKETNIVIGTSMFGKTVYVKLPNGGVVSIGKADDAKLRAAKKSQAAA